MATRQESPAVATAVAHCQAWSTHDWDAARRMLAADIQVAATTTAQVMPATNLNGVDPYMEGLQQFAGAVIPGSLQVHAQVGDERNALVMLTVQVPFGRGGAVVPLTGARLYLLDEAGKIKTEQVIFFVAES